METRLEIFSSRNLENLKEKQRETEEALLRNGWRHDSVAIASNAIDLVIMAVIYKKE